MSDPNEKIILELKNKFEHQQRLHPKMELQVISSCLSFWFSFVVFIVFVVFCQADTILEIP